MADTYYDRLKGEDTRSVEELCRPLSAKVMPRTAMLSLVGEKTEGQALGSQRRNGVNGTRKKGRRVVE